MNTVRFTRLEDATKEEFESIVAREEGFIKDLPNRILAAMEGLKVSFEGFPVTRYEHSLQSATRAYRNGESEEIIVAALLHDIGDLLAPGNHGEIAAAVLKLYVSEQTHWIVKHHALFQSYYYAHHLGGDRFAREKYRDHPYYQKAIEFCEQYDQNCFDPNYESMPIEFFEPMVRKIFSQPLYHSKLP
ncbi:MAG: HD domain-containing protein [Cyanobacteriota bacterium]|nr:HD domain-containing protein [Cyanobacteriota bacterium]